MPIALLLAPLLATATVTTTSTATIVGAAAAGAGGTAAAGTGIWYFFFREKEPEKPSRAHQDSVNQQNIRTRRRIDDAEEAVSLLRRDVNKGISDVRSALANSVDSTQALQQSVNSMVGVTQQLAVAKRDVVSSTEVMSNALPVVQELAENTGQDSLAVVARLDTLNQHLDAREGEIKRARIDIEKLTEVVDTQSRAVEQLTGVVKTLTDENEDLKGSLASQHQKYARLEDAAKHADNNHRLFRHAVQEFGTLPVDRVSNQTISTQTFFK